LGLLSLPLGLLSLPLGLGTLPAGHSSLPSSPPTAHSSPPTAFFGPKAGLTSSLLSEPSPSSPTDLAPGQVGAFGHAPDLGGPGTHLAAPIVGIAPSPTRGGYWLVGADGGVFAFGDASFFGSLAGTEPSGTEVAGLASAGGRGYWLATRSAPPDPGPAVSASSLPASGASPGRALGSFVITCYDLSGDTATGVPTNPATVAVDPAVVPLGSHIYIAGVGWREAEDTGGAIVGHRLDIWEPTYAQCSSWGVQVREVWMGS